VTTLEKHKALTKKSYTNNGGLTKNNFPLKEILICIRNFVPLVGIYSFFITFFLFVISILVVHP
jgi:hypothetical protein